MLPANKERHLFAEALDLPAENRREFIAQACGADKSLLERVQNLLDAHADDSPVLKTLVDASPGFAAVSEGPGTKIGHYKLLQKIGEGGMGVVYMAEQTEPVTRKVALKIIKLGMDTREVVARFEAERQALAMMDHPNIARVLDAGATEAGRPYFVMEMVKGISIAQFCDENKLSPEERLELFIDVCSAIQHAHQKGIIHRDIKPSNILVTLHGDRPVPKVIDFGIAKATQGKLTDKTLFTQYQQVIGTPAYMSPEQATMSGLDIDTRSDIYALGVLLYELLTGKTPFDPRQLLSGGYEELRRRIREEEPLKPSNRLSTMHDAERTTLARLRRISPKDLAERVRGELDWIVMKAIDKDRGRRYDTADALALDVRRHLDGEPVSAVPPSNLYRFKKFATKHRTGLAIAAAFALLLLGATGLSTWFAWKLKGANARIRQEVENAQLEADKSREVIQFFNRDVLGAAYDAHATKDITLRQVLDISSSRVQNRSFKHPLVQSEVLLALAKTYYRLGDTKKAATTYESALRIQRETLGEQTAQTANTMIALADSFSARGRFEEAHAFAVKAIEIISALKNPDELLAIQAHELLLRNAVAGGSGADPKIVAEFDRLIRNAEERFPNNAEVRANLANAMVFVLGRLHRFDEARAYAERAQKIRESSPIFLSPITPLNHAVVGWALGEPALFRHLSDQAFALLDSINETNDIQQMRLGEARAYWLMATGKFEQAKTLMEHIAEKVAALPQDEMDAETIVKTLEAYADSFCFNGKSSQALNFLLNGKLARSPQATAFSEFHRSRYQHALAGLHAMQERYESALACFESVDLSDPVQDRRKALLLARNHQDKEFENLRTALIERFKDWNDRRGLNMLLQLTAARPSSALDSHSGVIRGWIARAKEKLPDSGPTIIHWLEVSLGLAHYRFQETESALPYLRSALAGTPPCQAIAHLLLARILSASHQAEAASHLEKAQAIRNAWPMLDTEALLIRIDERLLYDLLAEEFHDKFAPMASLTTKL